mgnify:CR=1 FL=1
MNLLTEEEEKGNKNVKMGLDTILCGDAGSNTMVYLNHGFPNCACEQIYDEEGFPHMVAYALREIEKDEPLYWDYGLKYFQTLKLNPLNLCPDALNDYLKQTNNLENIGPCHIDREYDFIRLRKLDSKYVKEKIPVSNEREKFEIYLMMKRNKAVLEFLENFPANLSKETTKNLHLLLKDLKK